MNYEDFGKHLHYGDRILNNLRMVIHYKNDFVTLVYNDKFDSKVTKFLKSAYDVW